VRAAAERTCTKRSCCCFNLSISNPAEELYVSKKPKANRAVNRVGQLCELLAKPRASPCSLPIFLLFRSLALLTRSTGLVTEGSNHSPDPKRPRRLLDELA